MEIKPIFAALMRNRTGPILVAVQVALSLAILTNALHIVNVRQAVAARPTGVTAEQDMFSLRAQSLKPGGHEEQLAVQQMEVAALRAVPGVLSVATTNQLPLSSSGNYNSMAARQEQTKQSANATVYVTADSLVKTYGLKLVEGRDFNADDYQVVDQRTSELKPRGVIITRALGEKVWPDATSFIGKTIFFGFGGEGRPATVIGVLERLQTPGAALDNGEYSTMLPARQTFNGRTQYAIRAEPGQIDRVMQDAQAAIRKVHNGQVVARARTMLEDRTNRYKADNALAWMLITVSGLLMVVTASGIVGMASLWVTQRRKQIGVRRALGARKLDILRYFITENVLITTTGIAGGLLGALALNQLLVSKLELARLPAEYMVIGAVAFWALGVAAVYGPAWRAASTSPALATRSA
jgi:putative ABC transport system permease protein